MTHLQFWPQQVVLCLLCGSVRVTAKSRKWSTYAVLQSDVGRPLLPTLRCFTNTPKSEISEVWYFDPYVGCMWKGGLLWQVHQVPHLTSSFFHVIIHVVLQKYVVFCVARCSKVPICKVTRETTQSCKFSSPMWDLMDLSQQPTFSHTASIWVEISYLTIRKANFWFWGICETPQ